MSTPVKIPAGIAKDSDVLPKARPCIGDMSAPLGPPACMSDLQKAVLNHVSKRESNARSYVRKFPMVIAKAQGSIFWDADGYRYIDFLSCAGTLALGHNHPVQREAILACLDSGAAMQGLDMASLVKDNYMHELFNALPQEMQTGFRVQFCGGSGSDAIDAAVKVCKSATGRTNVLCFHGAYHGMGQGPLAMMGNLGTKGQVTGLMTNVQFLPYPNNYRQPFGLEATEGGQGDQAVMTYIEHMLDDDESGINKPACIVLECVQGEGGLNTMSDWALRQLRRITKDHDIPLIVDEIQSGFCRSGRMFAFEYSGIIPDVVTMSKAAGGSQPLACIVFKDELNMWSPGAHTGTFRGNNLAFASGAASLKFMRETRLWEQAFEKGQLLNSLIKSANSPFIGSIRGRGLMCGIELVDPYGAKGPDGLPPPSGLLCSEAQAECFRRGLIIEKGGRQGAVLRPLPALTIPEYQIKEGVGIIIDAIQAAARSVFGRERSLL